jgi:hypothetical protein
LGALLDAALLLNRRSAAGDARRGFGRRLIGPRGLVGSAQAAGKEADRLL